MVTFEYRVFNIQSDTAAFNKTKKKDEKRFTWLDCLNILGREGWELTANQPTKGSYILKRKVT